MDFSAHRVAVLVVVVVVVLMVVTVTNEPLELGMWNFVW
jgi:hypothetical protein